MPSTSAREPVVAVAPPPRERCRAPPAGRQPSRLAPERIGHQPFGERRHERVGARRAAPRADRGRAVDARAVGQHPPSRRSARRLRCRASAPAGRSSRARTERVHDADGTPRRSGSRGASPALAHVFRPLPATRFLREVGLDARRRLRHRRRPGGSRTTHAPRTTGDVRFGDRRRRQDAAVAEQPRRGLSGRQRDAAHVAAADAVDAVVARQALVQERVVARRAARARCGRSRSTCCEQQLRLARKAVAQVCRRSPRSAAAASSSSRRSSHWPAKFSTSALRARVGEHALALAARAPRARAACRRREPAAARRRGCCSRERTTGATRARSR